jgi:putative glutamine amidotransferase
MWTSALAASPFPQAVAVFPSKNESMSVNRRPIIGITCYVEQAIWGPWDAPTALLLNTYVEAITASGGRAVILPPDPVDGDVASMLDGLVLAGGADIDPARYGATPHPETAGIRPTRDAGELVLLAAALDRDLPILGVCRGMQLMAVAAGGSLHQHAPDVVGTEEHRPLVGEYGRHDARFAPDSLVAGILGEHLKVNSYHHQLVADPGTLTVTGWAGDDTIEALEDPAHRFYLGVQWHPEATTDHRLFAALVTSSVGSASRTR